LAAPSQNLKFKNLRFEKLRAGLSPIVLAKWDESKLHRLKNGI
jgi:hypothetical protein